MLLRPRKFTFKTRHRSRKFIRPVTKLKLVYGQIGLKTLQPSRLYSKQMYQLKIFISKGSRRSSRTRRQCWFGAFPHFPLTKKFKGARMGKGKSKLKDWVAFLSPGVNIVEYKNLHYGRAFYFINQIKKKLNVKSTLLVRYKKVNSFYSTRNKVNYFIYW